MLIRPLAYCRESDLIALAELKQFPIIPCNLCGSQTGLQRNAVKDMLKQWERQFPGRIDAIFGAIKNVAPSQLADTELFDFAGLTQGELDIDESKHIEIESLIQAINV